MTTRDLAPWLLVLVAASLVLAGCTGPGTRAGDEAVGPPSGEVAAEAFADIRSLNVTTRFRYERPSGNETIVRHYVIEPGTNKIWMEILAPARKAGNLQVSNGSVMWEYNATRNEAVLRRYEGDNRSLFAAGNRQYIFDRLNDTRDASESSSSVGVSPLPVVPAGGGVGENLSLADVSLEYGGTQRVAGREAYVVHMAANESRTGLRNQTVWYDAETFYRLRVETVFVAEGDVRRRVEEVTRASFDESFAEDRFVFDPPADATVRRGGRVTVRSFESRATLDSAAQMALPDPELSGSFTFNEGRHVVRYREGHRTNTTSQIYTRQFNSLVVLKSTATQPFDALTANASVESLSVGGHEAYFLERPRILLWRCDGHLYRVAGLFPKDRLVRIAESMACE